MFLLFERLPQTNWKWVNGLAVSTFGVLLIHDHGFFRAPLWHQVVKAPNWYYADSYLLKLISWTVIIFMLCAVIDMVRVKLIEEPLMKTTFTKQLISKMTEVWNEK